MNCAVGSFLINSTDVATTVISVTGLSFQPTVVRLWWNGNTSTTDAVAGADHRLGRGAAVSTTGRWAITSFADDGAGTMVTSTAQTDQGCVLSVNTAGSAIDGRADFSAFQSDGFDVIVDVQFPVSLRVFYQALDPTSAVTGTVTEAATVPLDVDVTGLAFQPELVELAHGGIGLAAEATGIDSRMTFGAATSSSAQAVWGGGCNDAGATAVSRAYCSDAQIYAILAADHLSLNGQATFVSMLADGFRLNFTVRSAARVIHYLAMAGNGQYAVASGTTQTDTTTPITMPGSAGIDTVVGGFVVSACRAESTTGTATATQECSIGAFSSASSRLALGMIDEDETSSGSSTSEIAIAAEFDAVYANISTADAIEGLMDVADMTAKTYIMDDADPSGSFFWNILFGTSGAPPAAVDTGGWDQLLSNRRNRLVRTG